MKKSLKYIFILVLGLAFISAYPAKSVFKNLFDDSEENVIYIKVKEISDNEGVVSTSPKKFRLIVDHNPNYIAGQNSNNSSSPFIQNLIILKRDLNRESNNLKDVTDDFDFEQEGDSFDSPEHDNYLRTTFISNNQIIKKAQRLSFKLDLTYYLRTLQIQIFGGVNTKAIYKLDIKALELNFSSLSLENKSLVFNPINPALTKTFYTTDNLNILGAFSSTDNLSDVVKQLQFESMNENGKAITVKLKKDGTKIKDLKLKPIVDNGNISINTNGNGIYNLVIPTRLRSTSKLNSKDVALISNYDLLVAPVVLDLKTGENLDLNISGTLRESVTPTVNAILE